MWETRFFDAEARPVRRRLGPPLRPARPLPRGEQQHARRRGPAGGGGRHRRRSGCASGPSASPAESPWTSRAPSTGGSRSTSTRTGGRSWSTTGTGRTIPFQPYGATVGHGLEWSRLLLHLEAAVGRAAHRTGCSSPRSGCSIGRRPTGGRWTAPTASSTPPTGTAVRSSATGCTGCWPRAFAAASALHPATGEQRYADQARTWWAYAERHLIDREHGSWHHQLDAQNQVDRHRLAGQTRPLPRRPGDPAAPAAARPEPGRGPRPAGTAGSIMIRKPCSGKSTGAARPACARAVPDSISPSGGSTTRAVATVPAVAFRPMSGPHSVDPGPGPGPGSRSRPQCVTSDWVSDRHREDRGGLVRRDHSVHLHAGSGRSVPHQVATQQQSPVRPCRTRPTRPARPARPRRARARSHSIPRWPNIAVAARKARSCTPPVVCDAPGRDVRAHQLRRDQLGGPAVASAAAPAGRCSR